MKPFSTQENYSKEVVMERLFSIAEAAAVLNVSASTIPKWFSTGRLARTKIGCRTMICESAMRQFIEDSNRAEPAKAYRKPSLASKTVNPMKS